MQRRKLDRNTWISTYVIARGCLRNLGNSIGIGHMIAAGIEIVDSRFTQHIITVTIALFFEDVGAFDSFLNGLAQHKLLPHFTHHPRHGLSDNRLPQTLDRAAQNTSYAFSWLI